MGSVIFLESGKIMDVERGRERERWDTHEMFTEKIMNM